MITGMYIHIPTREVRAVLKTADKYLLDYWISYIREDRRVTGMIINTATHNIRVKPTALKNTFEVEVERKDSEACGKPTVVDMAGLRGLFKELHNGH